MAPRLGGTFATGALGPVHYAGQLILARKVEEGLRELTPDNLGGGVARGVQQAAALAGVLPSDIEHLLPMAELNGMLGRIAASQPRVMQAWKLHAGGLGGLLDGVADLTIDGRAPDTALSIQRLAWKVQRDKPLAQPLKQLADDMADWQEALHRCVDVLNDTKALQRAYEMRRLRKIALIGGGAGLIALLIVSIVVVAVRRARIAGVIEQPDPCAVMDLTEADLDRVSDELRERARESRAKCEAARAAEAKRIEDERLREERERAAKKAQEELEARCDALAASLAAGKLSPEDEALAKDAAPLLGRVAKGVLDVADLGPAEPVLPCKDTKAEAKVKAAFRKAALAKPWNLPKAESPSAAVREAMAEGAADLPEKVKLMMSMRAGDASKRAIASGKAEQATTALALCEAAKAVGTEPAGPCDAVKSVSQK
jgi:hypothetical protein